MTTIPASLHRLVIQRAGDRCEYCRLSQAGQEAAFHIDHIIPVVAGGAIASPPTPNSLQSLNSLQ